MVHGGAGSKQPTRPQLSSLTDALTTGMRHLQKHESALEAVEVMIRHLEESGLFNAGIGSRRQLDGVQRMDAALMEGERLRAGGVACVERLHSPIAAARFVMDYTNHVLLVGEHATRFVQTIESQAACRSRSSKARSTRKSGSRSRRFSVKALTSFPSRGCETVGAVALDHRGHVAAGASTGGIPRMLPGRVGDSPIIGAGIYADDQAGAISMTGLGEGILRLGMAKTMAVLMQQGKSPGRAARTTLLELTGRLHGEAGCLVLSPSGRFAVYHTTAWMSAGYWNGRGNPIVRPQWRRVSKRKDNGA